MGILAIVMAFVMPTTPADVAILPRPVGAFFNLPPSEIQRHGLTRTVKDLGLAVKFQVFNSPAYSRVPSFPAWKAAFESEDGLESAIRWCEAEDIDFIAGGDEFCREQVERDALDGIEWVTREAVPHLAARIARSGRCKLLGVVDESNTKLPAGWKPTRLVGPWRSAGGPPIAWPSLVHPSPLETAEHSDATAREWMWWGTYSLKQRIRAIWDCTRNLPPGRVMSCLVCTIARTEMVDAAGKVWSYFGGVKPGEIMAQSWAALARGASILEYYGFDWDQWIEEREESKPGAYLQTGIRPGSDLWADFEATQRSILEHAEELAGKPFKALWRPPHLCGRRGKLAWSVSMESGRVRFWRAE